MKDLKIYGEKFRVEGSITKTGKPATILDDRGLIIASFPEYITIGGKFLHNEFARACCDFMNKKFCKN